MTEPGASRNGLLASLARAGTSLASLAEYKLLLFANELEAERLWAMRLALRLMMALLAMMACLLFVGALLALALWEWNRWLALIAPALLFFAFGAWAWNAMVTMGAAKPPAFGQTLAELGKDRDALAAFCGGTRQGAAGDD
jgi:uncharacterized membrane protein YqjE